MLINQNNYCIGDIIIYVGFTRIKIGKINELSHFYYPTGEVLMGVTVDHPYKGKEYTPVEHILGAKC